MAAEFILFLDQQKHEKSSLQFRATVNWGKRASVLGSWASGFDAENHHSNSKRVLELAAVSQEFAASLVG